MKKTRFDFLLGKTPPPEPEKVKKRAPQAAAPRNISLWPAPGSDWPTGAPDTRQTEILINALAEQERVERERAGREPLREALLRFQEERERAGRETLRKMRPQMGSRERSKALGENPACPLCGAPYYISGGQTAPSCQCGNNKIESEYDKDVRDALNSI